MSASPPPFQPGAPEKNAGRNTKLYVGVTIAAVVLVVVMCGGLLFGIWSLVTGTAKMVGSAAQCPMTFGMATQAAMAYAAENGGKLPPAATWQKDIAPYYKKLTGTMAEKTKDIPLIKLQAAGIDVPLACSLGDSKTAIVYNSLVAGKKTADFKDPSTTVLFFEKVDTPKMNYAEPYKEGGKQPSIFGEVRELIVTHVDGEFQPLKGESETGSIKIDFRDALDQAKKEISPAPSAPSAPEALPGPKGN
jgi:hypothetical protein